MADEQPYVTNGAWLRQVSRVDTIDEIADQFERPQAPAPASGSAAFWSEHAERRHRATGGWRSAGRFHAPSERAAS